MHSLINGKVTIASAATACLIQIASYHAQGFNDFLDKDLGCIAIKANSRKTGICVWYLDVVLSEWKTKSLGHVATSYSQAASPKPRGNNIW